ncbi:MAG: gliding motility-associated C-terminal domain-containing protein [Marinoscillum sp.]
MPKLFLPLLFFILCIGGASAQCIDDDILMFPDRSNSIFTGFGEEMATYGNHLAVSSPSHDSLAFDGGIVSIFKNVDGVWIKQARLTPSEPYERMNFGFRLAMNENMVLAFGRHENGVSRDAIYAFTKFQGEDWVDSHESFQFEPYELGDELLQSQMTIDLNDKFLAISYLEGRGFPHSLVYRVKVYEVKTGSFKLKWVYDPVDAFGDETFLSTPTLGDDFLVLTNGDSPGRAIIFSYDEMNGWLDDFVELTPSIPNQTGFGQSVATVGSSIFISNRSSGLQGSSQHHIFHYEKNGSEWSNMEEASVMTTDLTGAFYQSMEASENVLVFNDFENLYLFTNHDGWEDKVDIQIDLANKYPAHSLSSMALETDYLVYGLVDSWGTEQMGNKICFHEWEDSLSSDLFVEPVQVLKEIAFHASNDHFAISSAFYRDNGVVGSNQDDDLGKSVGAVYLYQRNNVTLEWQKSGKLFPSQIQAYMNFGFDVAMGDDMLFVSSPTYDSLKPNGDYALHSMGKVYQYQKTTAGWELFQEIISPDVAKAVKSSRVPDIKKLNYKRSNEDFVPVNRLSVDKSYEDNIDEELKVAATDDYGNFGMSLTYHNGYLAVGQRIANASDSKGHIYLYKQTDLLEWIHVATLTTSDSHRDWLGMLDMVMNDSLLVTGNSNGIYGGNIDGSLLYKKEGNEWVTKTEDAVLVPDRFTMDGSYPLEEFDNAGIDAAIFQDYIVMGAPTGNRSSRTGSNSGRAYVYRKPQEGWEGEVSYSNILQPENPIENSLFGVSIYMDDKNILIGAPHSYNQIRRANRDLDTTLLPGRVYIFDSQKLDSDIVHEIGVILPNDGEPLDGFGADISENYIELVIQAPYADTDHGFRSGQAYMFKKVSAIEEDIGPLCSEGGTVDLIAYPVTGGIWSGKGIINSETGLFDPSSLEEDIYHITYQYGDCISSANIEVYNPPVIESRANDRHYLCAGDSATLFVNTSNDHHSLRWYYKEESDDAYELVDAWNDQSHIRTNQIGLFKCEVTNGVCDGVFADFNTIRLNESTRLNASGIVPLCEGDTFLLKLSTGKIMDEYTWYGDLNGFDSYVPLGSDTILNVGQSGRYHLEFASNGCIYKTNTVRVDRTDIEISFAPLPDVCDPETVVKLEVTPPGGIFTITGLDPFDETSILASSLGNGAFNIKYEINEKNCFEYASQNLNILFFDQESLQIPNVFTPNGDDINDTFFLQSNYYNFKAFMFQVMDRNGARVFQTYDPQFAWSGDELPIGVYYWLMEFENPCTSDTFAYSGYVQILR